MAGETIHAMQLQMLVKSRQAQKPLERGLLHAMHIGETHVIVDQRENLFSLVVRESQTPQNFGSHLHANINVSVEADAIGGDTKSWRLADIMQQRSPGQSLGRSSGEFIEQ